MTISYFYKSKIGNEYPLGYYFCYDGFALSGSFTYNKYPYYYDQIIDISKQCNALFNFSKAYPTPYFKNEDDILKASMMLNLILN